MDLMTPRYPSFFDPQEIIGLDCMIERRRERDLKETIFLNEPGELGKSVCFQFPLLDFAAGFSEH